MLPVLPRGELLEDYIHIQKDMLKEINMESLYDRFFKGVQMQVFMGMRMNTILFEK